MYEGQLCCSSCVAGWPFSRHFSHVARLSSLVFQLWFEGKVYEKYAKAGLGASWMAESAGFPICDAIVAEMNWTRSIRRSLVRQLYAAPRGQSRRGEFRDRLR